MSPGSFKNIIHNTSLLIIYEIHMYKEDLTLNNLQGLICHKTQPTNPTIISTCKHCPVDWGSRIHRLHLSREIRPPTNECSGYDTKSDVEVSVRLELWGMWSTRSLPSLLGPLWFGVVAPDRVLSMGQIELNCVLMLN